MASMVEEYEYLPGYKLKLKIRPCPVCGEPHEIVVGQFAYEDWCDGVKSLAEAFPELSYPERELLLTGIDGECYAKMMKEE